MNAQTFCAQFNTEVTLPPGMRSQLQLEREIFGYKVYRLLDRLVLEREGRLYIHARPGETDAELTRTQLARQDAVDNAIYRLINELRPEGTAEIPWCQECLARVRHAVLVCLQDHIATTDAAFYPALSETTDSPDDDLMRQFAEIAYALSPEQLDCDGEVPPREVKRRRARLQRQWRALERQAGRVVTEDEVWAWNNAHHRIQGEKP
jgi:hypothetical protein